MPTTVSNLGGQDLYFNEYFTTHAAPAHTELF